MREPAAAGADVDSCQPMRKPENDQMLLGKSLGHRIPKSLGQLSLSAKAVPNKVGTPAARTYWKVWIFQQHLIIAESGMGPGLLLL